MKKNSHRTTKNSFSLKFSFCLIWKIGWIFFIFTIQLWKRLTVKSKQQKIKHQRRRVCLMLGPVILSANFFCSREKVCLAWWNRNEENLLMRLWTNQWQVKPDVLCSVVSRTKDKDLCFHWRWEIFFSKIISPMNQCLDFFKLRNRIFFVLSYFVEFLVSRPKQNVSQ